MSNKKHNSKYILRDEGTGFPFFIFIHWHLINISVFPLTAKQGQFKHVQTEINMLGTVGHSSWKAELYLHCPYLSPGYKKCGFKGRQWRERGMLSIRCQLPEEKSPFMIKSSAKGVQSRKLVFISYVIFSTSAIISIHMDISKSNVVAAKLSSDEAPWSFKKDKRHLCKAFGATIILSVLLPEGRIPWKLFHSFILNWTCCSPFRLLWRKMLNQFTF